MVGKLLCQCSPTCTNGVIATDGTPGITRFGCVVVQWEGRSSVEIGWSDMEPLSGSIGIPMVGRLSHTARAPLLFHNFNQEKKMKSFRRSLVLIPLSVCLAGPAMIAQGALTPTINDVNLALQNNDLSGMEEMCREIVAADPSNAQGWFLLGYALHAQGELDEAILMHITATSFPETAPLAYYNLGCAQALRGKTDLAFTALHKAAELGIKNAQQYRGDGDLASLHDDPRWDELLESFAPKLTAKSKSESKDAKASGVTPDGLHFWVGDWDCYSAKDGKLMGTNSLSFRVDGLVIHEQWESTGGSYMGESWNFFDPIKKAWKQTWVGSGGGVTQFGCRQEDGCRGRDVCRQGVQSDESR